MDVESEQSFHDLEQRYITLKKEHDLVLVDKDSLQAKVSTLQGFLDQNAQQLSLAERKVNDHNMELAQRDKLVQDLSSANEELNDRCRRRSDECDRLRDELKAQAAELVTLQTRLKDSQLNLNEFQTNTLPTQYELTKTIHEKNLLVEQVKYLEEEVRKKTQDDRSFRAESSNKIHELEVALSQATTQAEDAARQLATVKDSYDSQAEKIDVYLSQLRESERGAIEKQSAFLAELESLKRLVELYKRYFEDATAKVTELEQHEEVMRETNANVLKGLRDKVTQQLAEAENAATKERAELENKVKDLEAQLAAAQEASSRSVVAFVESGPTSSSSAHASNADSIMAVENFDGIGITELYDRVVKTEKELYAERSKRREVELYMQQILKDVESKAPIIAAQRRDYHRVVESHTALTRRLDVLVAENLEIKQTLHSMRQHTQEAEEEAHVLAEHNADLSRQVQNLLKRSMGIEFGNDSASSQAARIENDTPSGVISEYLVTFDTIEELQQRNAELLRVVRKLSRDQEQLSQQQAMITEGGESEGMDVDTPTSSRALVPAGSGSASNNNAALQAALEELAKMREARQRTEEMVSVLTQQRDMYRSMAEGDTSVFRVSSPAAKSPGGGLFGAQTPAAGSSSASSSETAVADNLWHAAAVRELQSKLSQVEDDRRRIQERLTRFEEAEKLLNENLDKVRKEATAARLEAAQGASEARFQRERAERLETTLASTQQESASALQRRLEMERTLLEAGKEARGKEDRITELYEQLRVSQDSQRRAEIEAEVARASETRLIAQIAEAREETRRHVSLVEHINRIESGLQSRVEAEKEALAAENESLKASFDTLRKQLDDRTLLDEQRAKVAEEEIRSIRSRLEQKTAEYASISEQLAREQITAHAAQERASLLERQLSLAQERLTHSQGSQIIESSMANDYTAKELALERAQTEITALREQVASTEVHAEQFRKISAVNEAALKDLRAKAAAAQAAQEAEVAKMREELEAAQKDMHENRTHSQGLLQEAEDAREQLRTFTAESAETVRKLEEALALLRQECDQLKAQGATVSGEIARYQDAARAAHQNYERELQLHAAAERELSELRRQIEETKQTLQHEQQRTAQLSADCIRKETQLSEERAKFQLENKDLNEHVKGLQYTNDLLHTQVQSYGLQIERLQEQRMFHAGLSSTVTAAPTSSAAAGAATSASSSAAAAATSDTVTMSEGDESAPVQTSAEGVADSQLTQPLPLQEEAPVTAATPAVPVTAADASTADAPYDEMSELRKSTSEMREVLRYMKREKDMLQAKLSVSETENTRLVSELQSLRRSLDEVRVELKRELDKRVPLRNAEEFNHLMSEVNQLNLYRESNQHMRAENEDLSKRLAATTAALSEAKDAAAPLEDTIRKLRAEKESLDMVNDQLTNDVCYWRTRLQTLISRYNDVDPEEHRLLKTKLEEVSASLAEAQQALETQREAQRVAAEEAAAAADAKDKELTSLKAQVTGAEASANKLRETLRTFKERFDTLRTQLKESEGKLAAEKQNSSALEAQIAEAKAQVESLKESLAAVNAAKSQVEAQLAASGPPGAGATAAAAAARRKRPAPGAAVVAAATPAADTTTAVVTTTGTPAASAAEAVATPVAAVAVPPAAAAPATTAPVDRAAKMKEGLLRKKLAAEKAAAEKAAAAATATAAFAAVASDAVAPAVSAADAVTGKRAAPEDSTPAVTAAEGSVTAASTTGASVTPAAKKRRPLPPTPPAAGTETSVTVPTTTTVAETPAVAAPVAVAEPAAVSVEAAEPAVDNTVEMSADQEVVDLVTSEAESGEIMEETESVAPAPAAAPASASTPAAVASTSAPEPVSVNANEPPVVAEKGKPATLTTVTQSKIGTGNPFAGSAAAPTTSTGVFGSGASMFKSTFSAPAVAADTEGAAAASPAPAAAKSFFGSSTSGPFSAPTGATGAGLFGSGFGTAPAANTNTSPVNNPWGAAKALNPAASAFAPTATVGFGTFGAPAATTTGVFGKSLFSAAPAAASATAPTVTSSLWGSATAPKTGILKSTSSGALDATAGAPSSVAAGASGDGGSSTVAILAPAPTSGPEYQKRIEARAARFAQSAAPAATTTAATTTTAPAPVTVDSAAAPFSNPFSAPKPATTAPAPVEQPVVETQLAPIEEEYVEEGELDEADMPEEGQEETEGAWDESNADSGDYEEGEI